MIQEASKNFVHLHVHSDYSLLDGACRIDRLLKRTSELGMEALAITDHGNLFGIPQFYEAARKVGIKPLLGCEIYLLYEGSRLEKRREQGKENLKLSHMCLLAKDLEGYRNLTKLVSDAHTHGFYYKPRTDMEQLAQYSKGLVATSGCLSGVLSQFILRNEFEKAKQALGTFIEIFGKENFFVEIQNQGMQEQAESIPQLLQLAQICGVRCVATNDVHYVYSEDWEAQDALLCIQTGNKVKDPQRMRMPTRQFYLKSRQEMEQAFDGHTELFDNTLLVAEMCQVELPFGANFYPVFHMTDDQKAKYGDHLGLFKGLCKEGLFYRYSINFETESGPEVFGMQPKEVVERLKYEWQVIEKTGFIDYFLIVWDFIHWAKQNGISVGPGRGSAAGSLVAYVLSITNTDPLRFNLLFERFLNPERVTPPDIDVDFCMRRREEVINYVRRTYGVTNVSNIITFGTLGAKMVVRDLARVYDVPYNEADRWSKMIPNDLKITLSSALEKSYELQKEVAVNPMAQKVFEEGQVLEGVARNSGTHACGIIISDQPLDNIVPMTLQEGALTTQYSKEFVEALGLLKMDFLGLRTLTIIDDSQHFVRELPGFEDFDIRKIPFDDEKTFQMLNQGNTVGVFQLESPFAQKLCQQFEMSSIDEISALSALNRPGPMEWIPDYIRGKKDPSSIHYVHPLLEPVCRKTYGVLVFQEQVMQAARVIAGYSLGGADILRRAMGKKKVEVMNAQRAVFVKGAWEHNQIEATKANEIFDILAKFAGYGFNKSHSDAYAIIIYQTAYLKANFPTQYMASILTSELGNSEKLSFFITHCRAQLGIEILGPDINESGNVFRPLAQKQQIRFGLGAIKGVGDVAAKRILEEREQHGAFKSFLDFVQRMDAKALNKRVLECLIKTGAFDSLGDERQYLLDHMDRYMKEVSSMQMDRDRGQTTLFDFGEGMNFQSPEEVRSQNEPDSKTTTGMSLFEKLNHERELLGFYLSGHPLDDLAGVERVFQTFDESELPSIPNGTSFRLCGIVEEVSKKISKKTNRPWLSFVVSTQTARHELQMFSDAFETYGLLIQEGTLLICEGQVRQTNDSTSLNVLRAFDFNKKFQSFIRQCHWILYPSEQAIDFVNRLADHIHAHEGSIDMKISFYYNEEYALEGSIPMCCQTSMTLQDLKNFKHHPAVYGLEITPTEIAPFPTKDFKRSGCGSLN